MRPVATSTTDSPRMPQNAVRHRNALRWPLGLRLNSVHQYQAEATIATSKSSLGMGYHHRILKDNNTFLCPADRAN
jgi:hypothetical protein